MTRLRCLLVTAANQSVASSPSSLGRCESLSSPFSSGGCPYYPLFGDQSDEPLVDDLIHQSTIGPQHNSAVR